MDGTMGRLQDAWDGSRPEISIWRNVLCSVARLSRMPVFPVTGCLRSFSDLGRACVLDFNAGESDIPVCMPRGGMETVSSRPPFRPSSVRLMPSAMVTLVCGGSRRRGCAGNGHYPG